jgi:hypothetical protein
MTWTLLVLVLIAVAAIWIHMRLRADGTRMEELATAQAALLAGQEALLEEVSLLHPIMVLLERVIAPNGLARPTASTDQRTGGTAEQECSDTEEEG